MQRTCLFSGMSMSCVKARTSYAPVFREHSTGVMTPELLAALAQVEGSGNPVVRTYWRWSFRLEPFEIYRPASSAVGMYQFTDGTFAEARRYCIHDHVVAEQGPWNDFDSCWFNSLYLRVDRDDTQKWNLRGLSDTRSANLLSIFSGNGKCGEGGIRTHVPFRTRRFRGAPVTTTSVPLRRGVWR